MFKYVNNDNKILILGGGELGREILISSIRFGLKTICVDNYHGCPASFVANVSYVCDMLDYNKLRTIFYDELPNYIICEKESINIDLIRDMEKEGFNIIPNSKSIEICMSREKLRKFAHNLNILTSKFKFCDKEKDMFISKINDIGIPCVVKPCFSSSGYGQTIIKENQDIEKAFSELNNARGSSSRIIIEEFIELEYEITIITIKQKSNIYNCEPIIHRQKNGDFYLSYQYNNIVSDKIKEKCYNICKIIVNELCSLNDNGIFGIEFFVKGDDVIFNEIAPRCHDTGFITLKTQNISQFDLLVYSILNIPIPNILVTNPGISHSLVYNNNTEQDITNYNINLKFYNNLYYYIFNKPIVKKKKSRRVGIIIYLLEHSKNNFIKEIEKIEEICKQYKHN